MKEDEGGVMERIMTTKRVKQLLAAYGSDSRRWPETERARAVALLERLPELRALVLEEQALDAMLERKQVAVSDAMIARVSARVDRGLSKRPVIRENGGRIAWFGSLTTATWPRAAAFAGIAMLGVIIGLSSDPSAFSTTTVTFDGSIDTGATSLTGEFSAWSE